MTQGLFEQDYREQRFISDFATAFYSTRVYDLSEPDQFESFQKVSKDIREYLSEQAFPLRRPIETISPVERTSQDYTYHTQKGITIIGRLFEEDGKRGSISLWAVCTKDKSSDLDDFIRGIPRSP